MQLHPGEYGGFWERQHFSLHLYYKSQTAIYVQIFYFQFSTDQFILFPESPLEYSLYSNRTSSNTHIKAGYLGNVWVWVTTFKNMLFFSSFHGLFQFTRQQVFGFPAAT